MHHSNQVDVKTEQGNLSNKVTSLEASSLYIILKVSMYLVLIIILKKAPREILELYTIQQFLESGVFAQD